MRKKVKIQISKILECNVELPEDKNIEDVFGMTFRSPHTWELQLRKKCLDNEGNENFKYTSLRMSRDDFEETKWIEGVRYYDIETGEEFETSLR